MESGSQSLQHSSQVRRTELVLRKVPLQSKGTETFQPRPTHRHLFPCLSQVRRRWIGKKGAVAVFFEQDARKNEGKDFPALGEFEKFQFPDSETSFTCFSFATPNVKFTLAHPHLQGPSFVNRALTHHVAT